MNKNNFLTSLNSILHDIEMAGDKGTGNKFKQVVNSYSELIEEYKDNDFWKELDQKQLKLAVDRINYAVKLFNSHSGHQWGWLKFGLKNMKDLLEGKNID